MDCTDQILLVSHNKRNATNKCPIFFPKLKVTDIMDELTPKPNSSVKETEEMAQSDLIESGIVLKSGLSDWLHCIGDTMFR